MGASFADRPALQGVRPMPVAELLALPAEHLALLREEARDAADLPNRFEWDQERPATAVGRVEAAVVDPGEHVETTLRVAERGYGAWPGRIRQAFEPVRSVRTGGLSFRLSHNPGCEEPG